MVRKLYCLLFKNKPRKVITMEDRVNLYRNRGAEIGVGCDIYSDISGVDVSLLKIGNNVIISNEVKFLLHDSSIIMASKREFTDILGKITIGDNCFIGFRSIILPGVSIANNTIVAAGSVVTKSIKSSGYIIGGNPARIIGTVQDFYDKNKKIAINLDDTPHNSIERINKIQNHKKYISRKYID